MAVLIKLFYICKKKKEKQEIHAKGYSKACACFRDWEGSRSAVSSKSEKGKRRDEIGTHE